MCRVTDDGAWLRGVKCLAKGPPEIGTEMKFSATRPWRSRCPHLLLRFKPRPMGGTSPHHTAPRPLASRTTSTSQCFPLLHPLSPSLRPTLSP